MNIKENKFLNGKVNVRQLDKGYRAGADSVILSSFVKEKGMVMDLGAGVGTVSLCILARIKEAEVFSIENNETFYKLSLENKEINQDIATNYNPLFGGVLDFKDLYNKFDIVVCNPPYYKEEAVKKSIFSERNSANIEKGLALNSFIKAANCYLKPKGVLYMINIPSRLNDIIRNLEDKNLGNIEVYPFYPYVNKNSNLIVVKAQKGYKGNLVIKEPILMHNEGGSYTEKLENILRNGII